MARARNLKPAFFKNELLAELPPLARLLFVGLWCVADREGRLEDRPKRLKVEVLPYDDCCVDELLGLLAARGFIVRYVVDAIPCIRIPAFKRHQNPHHREAASVLPDFDQAQPVPAMAQPEASPGLSLGQAAKGSGSAVLIPDSLLLIPDSLKEQERPPSARKNDPIKDMIDAGIEFMAGRGVSEKQARSVIGLLRKEVVDDLVVSEILAKAQREGVADPVPWLRAAAKSRSAVHLATYTPVAGEA